MRAFALFFVIVATFACGTDDSTDGPERPGEPIGKSASELRAPLTEAPGAAEDRPDFSCAIVLRSIGRVHDDVGGYLANGSSWIWDGTLDAADEALAQGAQPAILVHRGMDPWREVVAEPYVGAAVGATRFRFRLDAFLPGPSLSGSSLAASRFEVIPILRFADGGRLFDHNTNPAPFENYVLAQANGWHVDNPFVCTASQPEAHLDFLAGWSHTQDTAIIAGGQLVVTYDLERLPTCRGYRQGHPSWDLRAHARFFPLGEERDATVRGFDGAMNGVSKPATFTVPPTATSVEIWFHNFNISTTPCEAWDSNYGENTRFSVSRAGS